MVSLPHARLLSILVLALQLGSCQEGIHHQERVLGLELGREYVHPLKAGESIQCELVLEEETLLKLHIQQDGVDVKTSITKTEYPDINLPFGRFILEVAVWKASAKKQALEVYGLEGQGTVRLKITAIGTHDATHRMQLVDASRQLYLGVEALDKGQLELAEKHFNQSCKIYRTQKILEQAVASCGLLGRAQRRLNLLNSALKTLDLVISELELNDKQVAVKPHLYYERGRVLQALGRSRMAEAEYRNLTQSVAQNQDLDLQGNLMAALAVLYDNRGDLEKACDAYKEASSLFKRIGRDASYTKYQTYFGRCLTKLGSLPEALPALLLAKQSADQLSPDESEFTELIALVNREIGWWYYLENKPEDALGFLLKAHALKPETSFDRLGSVYKALGDFSSARDFYQLALQHDLVRGDTLSEAHVRSNLCSLDGLESRFDEGIQQCQTAQGIFRSFGANGSLSRALLRHSELERARGNLEKAEFLAEEALENIESQRARLSTSHNRQVFLAERVDVHQALIELRMKLEQKTQNQTWSRKALDVSELTRARSLFDLLSSKHVDPGERVAPELRAEEQSLLSQIAFLLDEYGEAALGSSERIELKSRLDSLAEELNDIHAKIKAQSPSYAALVAPEYPDISKIQSLLDSDSLLLVYHLGEDESYLWLVSHDQISTRILAGRHQIERLVSAWYGGLANSQDRWQNAGTERRWAQSLSKILLMPISEELPRWRRLVFVTDGSLQRLPFGALPSPRYHDPSIPLITDHEIVYLPSTAVLTILRGQHANRKESEGLIAIVADPIYTADDPRIRSPKIVPTLTDIDYPRLPHAGEEARDIIQLMPGQSRLLLDGAEACKTRIMQGALKGYHILHFATHARTFEYNLNSEPDQNLGLVLSRYDQDGLELDSLLGLQDLYSLDLPSDMAVLSACGTALGKQINGEGLIGMMRGFMHAGTPRIIVSLWAVQDKVSREFMRRFYRELFCSQVTPAEALRRAQLAMLEDKFSIHHWGAYTFNGDWLPFDLELPRCSD